MKEALSSTWMLMKPSSTQGTRHCSWFPSSPAAWLLPTDLGAGALQSCCSHGAARALRGNAPALQSTAQTRLPGTATCKAG